MKTLIALLTALVLTACGKKTTTAEPYSGNFKKTGRSCTRVAQSFDDCSSTQIPAACGNFIGFTAIYINHDATNGILNNGVSSHLTIAGNQITHDVSGISFKFRSEDCVYGDRECTSSAPVVFEFAPGCAFEFERLNF